MKLFFLLITALTISSNVNNKPIIQLKTIDLPEEISQAKSGDTLIVINDKCGSKIMFYHGKYKELINYKYLYIVK